MRRETNETGLQEVEKWYSPFHKVLSAMLEWSAHTIVVLGLILGFWIVEQFIHYLWKDTGRLLFNYLPLSYVFDAADLAILIVFLTYGIYCVMRAYAKKN